MTETELRLIAAAAIIGFRRTFSHGYPFRCPCDAGVCRYGQLPPFGIECEDESPLHFRSQVALVQLTEHDPVQVM